MALEDLSTTTKKVIVYTGIVLIILLKIFGVFKSSRLPWYMLGVLGAIAVVTDAQPVAADTLPGKATNANY
jgi:hypothetical protein